MVPCGPPLALPRLYENERRRPRPASLARPGSVCAGAELATTHATAARRSLFMFTSAVILGAARANETASYDTMPTITRDGRRQVGGYRLARGIISFRPESTADTLATL